MDSIKAQKIEAMKSYKRAQFLYNLTVYSLTAFLSCLFYLYLFWFPSASMNHLFSVLVPNIYSFFVLSPNKLLFIVGNLIVLFLLGESKLGSFGKQRPPALSPADEIHEEYVRRSKSMRREGSFTNLRRKKSEKNLCDLEAEAVAAPKMRREGSSTNLRRKKSVRNLCAMENSEKVEGVRGKIAVCDVDEVAKIRREGSSTNLRRKKSVKNLCAMENSEKVEGVRDKIAVCDVHEVAKIRREGSSTNLRRKKSVKNLCAMENCEKVEGAQNKFAACDEQEERPEEVEKVCNVQEEKHDAQLAPRADVRVDEVEVRADVETESFCVQEEEEHGVLLLARDRDDELKTRAENFIARVNRQMMLEESIW